MFAIQLAPGVVISTLPTSQTALRHVAATDELTDYRETDLQHSLRCTQPDDECRRIGSQTAENA